MTLHTNVKQASGDKRSLLNHLGFFHLLDLGCAMSTFAGAFWNVGELPGEIISSRLQNTQTLKLQQDSDFSEKSN